MGSNGFKTKVELEGTVKMCSSYR